MLRLRRIPRLHHQPTALHWAVLLVLTLLFVLPLELIRLPAAILLGAMAAAIVTTGWEGRVALPVWPVLLAQGLVGCLMGRNIGPGILTEVLGQLPLFVLTVGSVVLVSVALGALLTRAQILPGTTAIWGSFPGAATVMVLMADAYGADMQLVAFMQFL